MSNIIKLSNGGRLQVRTGVLQGVGPQGPTGPAGPAGPQGGDGPQGAVGPQGAIQQVQAQAAIAGAPLTAGNLVSWNPNYDDPGVFYSSSEIRIQDAGDYLISVWMDFDTETAAGQVSIVTGATVLYRGFWGANSRGCSFTAPLRSAANASYNLVVGNTAIGLTVGSITVTRIGSGPIGPQGPQGAQGIAGPAGPAGAQGPAGNASGGFATYGDLL